MGQMTSQSMSGSWWGIVEPWTLLPCSIIYLQRTGHHRPGRPAPLYGFGKARVMSLNVKTTAQSDSWVTPWRSLNESWTRNHGCYPRCPLADGKAHPYGLPGPREGFQSCTPWTHLGLPPISLCPWGLYQLGPNTLPKRYECCPLPCRDISPVRHQRRSTPRIGPFATALHHLHGRGDCRSAGTTSLDTTLHGRYPPHWQWAAKPPRPYTTVERPPGPEWPMT